MVWAVYRKKKRANRGAEIEYRTPRRMKMVKLLVIAAAIISPVICYACCVAGGRADDRAEEFKWMVWDEEDGQH